MVLKHATAEVAGVTDLEREFALLSRLHHPHLVRCMDVVNEGEGAAFLVLEHVAGIDIATWAQGEREPRAVVGLALQVLAVLGYLHGNGVVHGDLKPSHLIVGGCEGRPRVTLIDLGFGALASARSARHGLGTVGYAAPEMLRGARPDARSDLYSFGAVLYELLAQRPPFRGRRLSEVINAQLGSPPPPLPDTVPRALAAAVWRFLVKAPAGRLASAREGARTLKRAVAYGRERLATADGELLSAPMVGREQALERACAILTASAPATSMLLVRGGRGMGKTRFLEELRGLAVLEGEGRRGCPKLRLADAAAASAGAGDRVARAVPPGYRADTPALLIDLEPLSAVQVVEVASSLLGGAQLPLRLAADLVERSGGIPGLVHVLVRRLLAEGLVRPSTASVDVRLLTVGEIPVSRAETEFLTRAVAALTPAARSALERVVDGEKGGNAESEEELRLSGLARKGPRGWLLGPAKLADVVRAERLRQPRKPTGGGG